MAINKTNLETQVQARIDGLTGTETLKDLLILSKAAEGLNVNRTALDTAIEAALGGLNGASEVKDLLVGNKSAADEVATLLGVNQHTTAEVNAARDSVIDAAKAPEFIAAGAFYRPEIITPPSGCRVVVKAVYINNDVARTIEIQDGDSSSVLADYIFLGKGSLTVDFAGDVDQKIKLNESGGSNDIAASYVVERV